MMGATQSWVRRARAAVLVTVILCSGPAKGVILEIDADDFSVGSDISEAYQGIVLSSMGTWGTLDGRVYARQAREGMAGTGANVFGNNVEGFGTDGTPRNETWIYPYAVFSAYFSMGARSVAIDLIGNDDFDWGAMDAYDAQGHLLESVYTQILTAGQVWRLEIARADYDITYVSVSGVGGSALYLDHLTVEVPEPGSAVLLGLGAWAVRRRGRAYGHKGIRARAKGDVHRRVRGESDAVWG